MDADGRWKIVMKTPLGSQEGTLTLAVEDGRVTGALESRLGSGPLEDGSVEAGTLSWRTRITMPQAVDAGFTATIEDDVLTGTIDFGRIGLAPFTGTRQ